MSNAFSKLSGRRALTLVEVIAGLVLLATLLTSVLAAFNAHATQIRRANDRLKATDSARELVAGWMSQGALPALGTQEALAASDGWAWRILANPSQPLDSDNIGSVRVEVFRSQAPVGEEVLASVTLLAQGNQRKSVR